MDGPTRTNYRKAHPMLLLQKEEQTRKTEEEDVPYLSDSREGSSDSPHQKQKRRAVNSSGLVLLAYIKAGSCHLY